MTAAPPGWPHLIGLTGANAAGKGEAAACLESLGYAYQSLSDVVRQEALSLGRDTGRDNLIRTGNELRATRGPGALVALLAPRLTAASVVDSIRNPGEVAALRELGDFILLAIEAPATLRWERLRARARPGDPRAFEDFLAGEARENSRLEGEQRLGVTASLADAVILNDGALPALRDRIVASVRRLRPAAAQVD